MITPEFQLLLDCCRSNFRNVESDAAVAASEIDWFQFIALAAFHRVEGFCWNFFAAVQCMLPSRISEALNNAATAGAVRHLSSTAECQALEAAFNGADIRRIYLKGLTLSALAYRHPALKSAVDIDLLVDPADLLKAADLLRDSGFHLVIPAGSAHAEDALREWHRRHKESVWVKGETRLQIDLHTQTADNPALISGITVHSPHQIVDVGGLRLPTLAREELFSYLAVHGASSAWFRLKWISDFAALLHGFDHREIDHLYRRSQELGAGRAAGQALLLADRLFGSLSENAPLRRALLADRATRWLFNAAWRRLTRRPEEPTARRFGTLSIHATQFLLKPGIRYKASEFMGQINRSVLR